MILRTFRFWYCKKVIFYKNLALSNSQNFIYSWTLLKKINLWEKDEIINNKVIVPIKTFCKLMWVVVYKLIRNKIGRKLTPKKIQWPLWRASAKAPIAFKCTRWPVARWLAHQLRTSTCWVRSQPITNFTIWIFGQACHIIYQHQYSELSARLLRHKLTQRHELQKNL